MCSVGSLWDWQPRCLALFLRSGTLPHGLHVPRKQVRRMSWQRRRLPSLTSLRRLPSQMARIQASPSLRLRSRRTRTTQPRLQLWELRREPRLPTSRHPTLSRLRPRCRRSPLRPPTQSPPLRGPREMARLWHPTRRRTRRRRPRRPSPPPRPLLRAARPSRPRQILAQRSVRTCRSRPRTPRQPRRPHPPLALRQVPTHRPRQAWELMSVLQTLRLQHLLQRPQPMPTCTASLTHG